MLIDSKNTDLVHHLLLYECDPLVRFNDTSLPEGLCDDLSQQIFSCSINIATGWAVGGDLVRL